MADTGATQRPFRILSLFSGSGMLDQGADVAVPGARVVGYVERQTYPATVLLARMEEQALAPAPIWCGDLADIRWSDWAGAVDCIVGGFPCQPWSAAGSKKGLDDERWLWPQVVEGIRQIRPRFVFVENVVGLDIGAVLGPLHAIGYDAEWGTLRASDVGATHQRRRVFILAYDNQRGRGELGFAQWSHGPSGADPDRRRRSPVATGAGQLDLFGYVADAECESGGEPEQWEARRWDDLQDRGGSNPVDLGEDVAHGSGEGRQGHGSASGVRAQEPVPDAGVDYLFAPGPRDFPAWSRILAVDPTLEPSLHVDVDGVAAMVESRTDQLRLTGNGVVPLQAAIAFHLLANRIAADI